jgi:hypothetical protein
MHTFCGVRRHTPAVAVKGKSWWSSCSKWQLELVVACSNLWSWWWAAASQTGHRRWPEHAQRRHHSSRHGALVTARIRQRKSLAPSQQASAPHKQHTINHSGSSHSTSSHSVKKLAGTATALAATASRSQQDLLGICPRTASPLVLTTCFLTSHVTCKNKKIEVITPCPPRISRKSDQHFMSDSGEIWTKFS